MLSGAKETGLLYPALVVRDIWCWSTDILKGKNPEFMSKAKYLLRNASFASNMITLNINWFCYWQIIRFKTRM